MNVDLQVNGYMGVDFSRADLTPEAVAKVCALLAERGTDAFLATVVTGPHEVYHHVLPVLAAAMELPACKGRLLGVHLEGPFISPEPGAVGAHRPACVLPPTVDVLDELLDLARGHVRLMTLAPEREGAVDVIRHAVARGVAVSLGHTLAGTAHVEAAVDAGATLSTHLGNGLPGQIDRHHNPLWPQLANAGLTAMLITDGHHIPPDFIRVVVAAKGAERIVVTSDSAPIAGLAPGVHTSLGIEVRLDEDGAIRNLEAPGLAGSASSMAACVRHLAALDLFTASELDAVTCRNPLRAIGLALPS